MKERENRTALLRQTSPHRKRGTDRHAGFEECGTIAGINEGGIGEVFFRKQLVDNPARPQIVPTT